MTTATDDTTTTAAEPELVWLSPDDLIPNPDNPRKSLGDQTEMVRSVKAHGVLEAVLCLPQDDNGKHMLVTGHRRQDAAVKARVEYIPAVVRAMTRVEALEAMLVENVERADLTTGEEIGAIEQLMTLDHGLSPARLCKRLGKSQAWVRTRMSLTVLGARWREAIDAGDLTLAAASAATTAADLGPEHIDALCESMTGRCHDPEGTVERYRNALRITADYEAKVADAQAGPFPVFTDEDPAPDKAKALGELFDEAGVKAHSSEPCHAVVVRRPSFAWSGGEVKVSAVCTDPRRHSAARVEAGTGSALPSDRPTRRGGGDDGRAKRQGRVARLAHATEVFGRGRGVAQRDLTAAAHRALIESAGAEATAFAAEMLGYDDPRNVRSTDLLASVESPADLARVAGAIAYGHAEARMYYVPAGCPDYVGMLTGTGWVPDEWTAAALDDAGTSDSTHDDGDPDDEEEPDTDDDPDPADDAGADVDG